MAKYKEYGYSQDVLIAVYLEDQLKPRSLEFAIHTLVETHWIPLFLRIDKVMMRQGVVPIIRRFF